MLLIVGVILGVAMMDKKNDAQARGPVSTQQCVLSSSEVLTPPMRPICRLAASLGVPTDLDAVVGAVLMDFRMKLE